MHNNAKQDLIGLRQQKKENGEVRPKTGETPTPKKEKKEKVDPRLERSWKSSAEKH